MEGQKIHSLLTILVKVCLNKVTKLTPFPLNTKPILEEMIFPLKDISQVQYKLLGIGGRTGWYGSTWLWKIRGGLDKLLGGVGFRGGDKTLGELQKGEVLDFWRLKERKEQPFYVQLEAEMKLPGKVCLEWKIEGNKLIQRIQFYPAGIWGKVYWYGMQPAHRLIFWHLGQTIAKGK